MFGVSDNEAVRIDPQQRYVLECTHMAMEDGGITRKHLHGTQTGVYIGKCYIILKLDITHSHKSFPCFKIRRYTNFKAIIALCTNTRDM